MIPIEEHLQDLESARKYYLAKALMLAALGMADQNPERWKEAARLCAKASLCQVLLTQLQSNGNEQPT